LRTCARIDTSSAPDTGSSSTKIFGFNVSRAQYAIRWRYHLNICGWSANSGRDPTRFIISATTCRSARESGVFDDQQFFKRITDRLARLRPASGF